MTIEDKAQAYDEAIRKAQDVYHTSEFVKITDLFPELADNEDEKIRKTLSVLVQNAIYPGLITEEDSKKCLTYLEKQKDRGPLTKEEEYILHRIIEYLEDETCPSEWISLLHGIYCLPYGKQKENIEKEYVFRPLGGTDITVAAGQAIKRVNEGERLVLAFNGVYIPVLKGYDVNEIVDIYNTFVEKRKELPFVKDVNVGYPGHYFYDGNRMYLCSSPALEEKQKEQKTTNELEDAFKYYTDRGITISCEDFKAEPKKEQIGEYGECTDFTIYHPLKNGKGEYECIPYSFYGSLTSFSEGKDLIDFLRTCFYTEEECNEWIKQQKEHEPIGTDFRAAVKNLMNLHKIKNEFTEEDYDFHAKELLELVEQKEQKPVRTAKQVWKEMRLEVYAQASGNRHEPNCSDDSTKMFSLCDIDEIFEKINDSPVGPQKPIECIEFDNEFEKQVSHLLASVLNGEWEYNEGFVKHAAQSLLGYAKHELELDGKALLYTADKSYQIGFRDGVASVKPEEWSEEDGKTINDACCWIAEYAGYLMDKNYGKASMLMGLTDKLKSLRPQSQGIYQQVVKGLRDMCDRYEQNGMFTDERARDFLGNVRVKCKDAIECAPILDEPSWKPSEEQMEALLNAEGFLRAGLQHDSAKIIAELYEQLKKL